MKLRKGTLVIIKKTGGLGIVVGKCLCHNPPHWEVVDTTTRKWKGGYWPFWDDDETGYDFDLYKKSELEFVGRIKQNANARKPWG